MRLNIFSNKRLAKDGEWRIAEVYCLFPLWCDDTESYHWLERLHAVQRFCRWTSGASKHDSGAWRTHGRYSTLELAEEWLKARTS